MKRFLFLAALVLITAACGAYQIGSGSNPTPSPVPPTQGMGYDVTATNTDQAVTMHVGQKLEVVLRASNTMNDWSHPKSSDTSVLAPIVDPAATAARGVTLAAFEAQRPGEVEVTSNASPKCPPGSACPMYVQVYALKVTVTQ